MTEATVATASEEMAAAWDAEAEGWLPHADRFERIGARHFQRFLAELPREPVRSVLDVGCGAGRATIELASRAPLGGAVGIDVSSRMVDYARAAANAKGITNATFHVGDAQVYPFERGSFDLVVSIYGLMFFTTPIPGLTNIRTSLRAGGRLVALAWREMHRNPWISELRAALTGSEDMPAPPADAPGPFAFAREKFVTSVLTSAGFTDVRLQEVTEPMVLGSDVADAFEVAQVLPFSRHLLSDLEAAERTAALDRLRRSIEKHATPDGVLYGASSWLITATVER